MKPNVLLIAHESMINGASFSLLGLIDKLSNRCNFIVVVPYNYGSFLRELKKRKVKIYYVPFERWIKVKDDNFNEEKRNWRREDDWRNDFLAHKMAELLKNEKIDIIHSNTSVVDFGYRLSKIMGVPHIWHIREFGDEDFSMYPLCSERQYYRKIAGKNNYLVCVSKTLREKFKNKVSDDRVRVIYNGVDKKNINPNKMFLKNHREKLICLQTGMINKAKGQDITIKAIEELRKEGYNNIELWLAGSGSLESLGINPSKYKWLKVLGQVGNIQDVRKDVNVEIVSSKKEAFGRVTVEAMMGQIPVIGSDSGGTKELIQDHETGLLFKAGDPEDLKEKIKYFYNHRNEIKRMGKNAYRFAKDYFLIDRCADEILKLYDEAAEENETHLRRAS